MLERRRAVVIAVLVVVALSVVACRGSGSDGRPGTVTGGATQRQEAASPSSGPSGAAPAPAPVVASDLRMIAEWAGSQVPEYPGARRVQFDPLPSQVENGGMMVYQTNDPPSRALAFYRGALTALGWQETKASQDTVVAQRGHAALTVTVTGNENGSAILLILADTP